MKDFSYFKSRDFYLSAVCLASGCNLTKLDRSKGDFVEFVFADPPERCHEIIAAYWADELKVNPKKLIEAINQLKTRIHSQV